MATRLGNSDEAGWFVKIWIPLFIAIFAICVSLRASSTCWALLSDKELKRTTDFLSDPKLNWIEGANLDLSRKPPPFFSPQIAAFVHPYMLRLPSGFTKEQRAFFNGIFYLLRDNRRVFHLMLATEKNILNLSADLRSSHPEEPETRIKARALLKLLGSFESQFGIQVETVHRALEMDELFEILNQGKTFIDFADSELKMHLGPGQAVMDNHWLHLKLAHRFQLYLVIRDFIDNPKAYGNTNNFLALYKLLGDKGFNKKLVWSRTGLEPNRDYSLFVELFDTVENNASSPGFFFEYQNHWPGLIIY